MSEELEKHIKRFPDIFDGTAIARDIRHEEIELIRLYEDIKYMWHNKRKLQFKLNELKTTVRSTIFDLKNEVEDE